MVLSDRLEANLATTEETRHRLLDTLLADALEDRVSFAIQAAEVISRITEAPVQTIL